MPRCLRPQHQHPARSRFPSRRAVRRACAPPVDAGTSEPSQRRKCPLPFLDPIFRMTLVIHIRIHERVTGSQR
ncbi:hypothetical protein EJB05_46618, partial [Eragrostis curvula]